MPAPGVIAVLLGGHTLLSLAALCVCTVAAEVMTIKVRPLFQTHPELNGCEVIGQSPGKLTE